MAPVEVLCPAVPVETFWTLLHDAAHWEFEIFLMLIFDVLIGSLITYIVWPKIKEHWAHHKARDKQDGIS
jgi:hypothetical protein